MDGKVKKPTSFLRAKWISFLLVGAVIYLIIYLIGLNLFISLAVSLILVNKAEDRIWERESKKMFNSDDSSTD